MLCESLKLGDHTKIMALSNMIFVHTPIHCYFSLTKNTLRSCNHGNLNQYCLCYTEPVLQLSEMQIPLFYEYAKFATELMVILCIFSKPFSKFNQDFLNFFFQICLKLNCGVNNYSFYLNIPKIVSQSFSNFTLEFC